jgi:hypothetical protein
MTKLIQVEWSVDVCLRDHQQSNLIVQYDFKLGAWGQCYKTFFTAVSCAFSKLARAFVPGKAFQPSLMFVGKVRSLP